MYSRVQTSSNVSHLSNLYVYQVGLCLDAKSQSAMSENDQRRPKKEEG